MTETGKLISAELTQGGSVKVTIQSAGKGDRNMEVFANGRDATTLLARCPIGSIVRVVTTVELVDDAEEGVPV